MSAFSGVFVTTIAETTDNIAYDVSPLGKARVENGQKPRFYCGADGGTRTLTRLPPRDARLPL